MDKKSSLKIWALQKGLKNFTELAAAAGLSRQAIYQAVRFIPGRGEYPPIGGLALHKLALALDQTDETIKDWYNGRVVTWIERKK